MTVAELMELLEQFPPGLPVFFCPTADELTAEHGAIAPRDAVMNLVDSRRRVAMGFSPDGESYVYPVAPHGFADALVIYPLAVQRQGFEVQRVAEQDAHEREKLVLRLEKVLLQFERRLPSGEPKQGKAEQ